MKDKVYQQILEHVIRLLSEHKSVEMIAGCLMVIAQRLYKTHLSPQDYKKIMKVASQVEVQPYDIRKGTLH
jgi:hypothetical protein|tara:strand:+ start:58 stop:270 length:213 start_codon:yes stop_codon:yes gene_type:complete